MPKPAGAMRDDHPRPEHGADQWRPDQPLHNLTVVECGHSVAAPFAAMALAELGAKVVKVEMPGKGDDARWWGAGYKNGSAAAFHSLNRDKLSIAVDLKERDQVANLRRFVLDKADIVLQNLRPGLSARFGIGDELVREKPWLIYCNIDAFGAKGPLSGRPGYDPLMQAFGGIMSITGEEGRAPVRVGPSIIDIAAGMWAVIGILAALNRRAETGSGCVVDTSLFETALAWMTVPSAIFQATGELPQRTGSEAAIAAPYKGFEAADGYLIIAAGNNNLFRRLATELGRPEWIDDPRYVTNLSRLANRDTLNAEVESIIRTATRAEWLSRLEAAGVPCAPLQNLREVLDHPQTKALEMMQENEEGGLPLMGLPLSFDGQRPPLRLAPPELGQHNHLLFRPTREEDDGSERA